MKRTWFPRFLSLLLTFVMLFELLPANVWATDAEADPAYTEPFSQDPAPEAPQDAPLSVVGEVESLRTQAEKHYRLSDGSYIAVNYGMPVHYALGDGDDAAWVDIDNTLTPSTSLQGTESSAVFPLSTAWSPSPLHLSSPRTRNFSPPNGASMAFPCP